MFVQSSVTNGRVLSGLLCALVAAPGAAAAHGMVIAPLIEGQSFCEAARSNPQVKGGDQADVLCDRLGKNGAVAISQVLDALGPARSPSGHFELGYTLIMPLLRFYQPAGSSTGWKLDRHAIDVALSTIADIDRPVVLHLSATHFNFEGKALAAELGKDSRNLMWTKDGPLRLDGYFNTPIYAWSLVDREAPVNRYRREAFKAVLDAVCRLPERTRQRIAAVTFLGETHQLFPDLQGNGSSYRDDFVITDYSPAAKADFRVWLGARFKTVQALNQSVGGTFPSFKSIEPPAQDLKGQPVPDRLSHMDESAAGSIAIFGWVAATQGDQPRIDVYVDGDRLDSVPADLSRLDVLDALPDLGTRNVGFRYDLDYSKLPPGKHVVDILAQPGTSTPYLLGEREITVLGDGAAPIAFHPLPPTRALDAGMRGYVDHPAPAIRVLYNPMARLWNEYRYQQVTRFGEQFGEIAQKSCLPHDMLFSHQILPALYPAYDPQKIGVEDFLKPNRAYNPGLTMYGGATYGDQFFRLKAAMGWQSYGLGEFHPLVKLSPAEYRAMFERHRDAGAVYIAPYYMSIFPQPLDNAVKKRLISPDNAQQGARELYQAIADLMRED